MVSYIARRIGVSILVFIAASFIMYVLAANSGDPLQDLEGSNSPNKQALIETRIHTQHLDLPAPVRWLLWLGGVARCIVPVGGGCDLGTTFQNQAVTQLRDALTAKSREGALASAEKAELRELLAARVRPPVASA